MILYLDTSALVKRYVEEVQTDIVIEKWREADEVVTSSVAYAEAMAAFQRKSRETPVVGDLIEQIAHDLREDWNSFIRIPVNDQLNPYIDQAIASHPLRRFDAIHLASAMIMHQKFQSDLLFLCFDQQLNRAATKESINTV